MLGRVNPALGVQGTRDSLHAAIAQETGEFHTPHGDGVTACEAPQEDTMGVIGGDGQKHHLFRTRAEEDAAVVRSPLKVGLDLVALAERVGGVPPQLYECAECSQPDCNWRGECDGESCPACGGHVVPSGVGVPAQGEPIERDGFGPRTPLRWPPASGVPACPAGWQLVPVKPTEEMARAGVDAYNAHTSAMFDRVWEAMLAAAPAPAGVAASQEPKENGNA